VFDIEIAADTIDRVVETVAALEPTFGGINLEDIKGPGASKSRPSSRRA
jgi:malate dehydrogenase (oxaloacetate-decarboxylating)(NADP+)